MFTKFFEKMDALPIVKLLQVGAVITFTVGLISVLGTLLQSWGGIESIVLLGMGIVNILYQPVIFLALAEIIKLKQKSIIEKEGD